MEHCFQIINQNETLKKHSLNRACVLLFQEVKLFHIRIIIVTNNISLRKQTICLQYVNGKFNVWTAKSRVKLFRFSDLKRINNSFDWREVWVRKGSIYWESTVCWTQWFKYWSFHLYVLNGKESTVFIAWGCKGQHAIIMPRKFLLLSNDSFFFSHCKTFKVWPPRRCSWILKICHWWHAEELFSCRWLHREVSDMFNTISSLRRQCICLQWWEYTGWCLSTMTKKTWYWWLSTMAYVWTTRVEVIIKYWFCCTVGLTECQNRPQWCIKYLEAIIEVKVRIIEYILYNCQLLWRWTLLDWWILERCPIKTS